MGNKVKGKAYFGTAGWSYSDWNGIVYSSRGVDKLFFLAAIFDTVEVNSTFYRIPPARYADEWLKKVEKNCDFKFCVKLWQGFTHYEEFPSGDEPRLMTAVLQILSAENRLGAVLIQFPWSFRSSETNLDKIKKIIELFILYPLIVEVRHRSWDRDEFYNLLEEKKAGFCNIDQPVIGESIAPSSHVTSSVGYVRLHGRNYKNWFRSDLDNSAERYDYLYSKDELEPWVDKIKEILQKTEDTFVIANNHWHGKAAHTALTLKNGVTGKKLSIPDSLIKTYPDLKEIALSQKNNQSTLFEE